jgi:hypothetical protein
MRRPAPVLGAFGVALSESGSSPGNGGDTRARERCGSQRKAAQAAVPARLSPDSGRIREHPGAASAVLTDSRRETIAPIVADRPARPQVPRGDRGAAAQACGPTRYAWSAVRAATPHGRARRGRRRGAAGLLGPTRASSCCCGRREGRGARRNPSLDRPRGRRPPTSVAGTRSLRGSSGSGIRRPRNKGREFVALPWRGAPNERRPAESLAHEEIAS